MAERFSNNGESALNGAINNSTTSVVVDSATTFPTAGNFRIRVDDEIMLVTAVSSNTFTATRGVEGSTAASHLDDAAVRHVLTAGAVEQFQQWTTVTKADDEDVTSSTTLQDDNHLFFTAVSGKTYIWEAVLIYASPAGGGTPDFRTAFGEDNNARGFWQGVGMNTSSTATAQTVYTTLNAIPGWGTESSKLPLLARGAHVGGGGTFKLQWAQNTSNGNPTRLYAGSILRYQQID